MNFSENLSFNQNKQTQHHYLYKLLSHFRYCKANFFNNILYRQTESLSCSSLTVYSIVLSQNIS